MAGREGQAKGANRKQKGQEPEGGRLWHGVGQALGDRNPAAGLPPLLRVPEGTKGFDLDLATSKGV